MYELRIPQMHAPEIEAVELLGEQSGLTTEQTFIQNLVLVRFRTKIRQME